MKINLVDERKIDEEHTIENCLTITHLDEHLSNSSDIYTTIVSNIGSVGARYYGYMIGIKPKVQITNRLQYNPRLNLAELLSDLRISNESGVPNLKAIIEKYHI